VIERTVVVVFTLPANEVGTALSTARAASTEPAFPAGCEEMLCHSVDRGRGILSFQDFLSSGHLLIFALTNPWHNQTKGPSPFGSEPSASVSWCFHCSFAVFPLRLTVFPSRNSEAISVYMDCEVVPTRKNPSRVAQKNRLLLLPIMLEETFSQCCPPFCC